LDLEHVEADYTNTFHEEEQSQGEKKHSIANIGLLSNFLGFIWNLKFSEALY